MTHEQLEDLVLEELSKKNDKAKIAKAYAEFVTGAGKDLRNGEVIDMAALLLSGILKSSPSPVVSLRRFMVVLTAMNPQILAKVRSRLESPDGLDVSTN